VCAVITTVSAYVSLGFSAAALIGSDKSVRTNPMYAFARSFALAVTCTIVMIGRLSTGLTAMAPTMIIVQSSDAVVGGLTRDRLKAVGPAATAVVNLAALARFLH